MQMSSGVQLPELHMVMRKRLPGPRAWPRLTDFEGNDTKAWADAPGLNERDTALLTASKPRRVSTFGCARGGGVLCVAKDSCADSCNDCAAKSVAHSSRSHCVPLPDGVASWRVTFVDEDLDEGTVGGSISWTHEPGDMSDVAEKYVIKWGKTAKKSLPGPAFLVREATGDPAPALEVPHGTEPPSGAEFFLIWVKNEAGEALAASVPIFDRFRPPSPEGFRFADENQKAGILAGEAQLDPPEDETGIVGYEMRFGNSTIDGDAVVMEEAPVIARVPPSFRGSPKRENKPPLRLSLYEHGIYVPKHATLLLAFAITADGARSFPRILPLMDNSGPAPPPPPPRTGKGS